MTGPKEGTREGTQSVTQEGAPGREADTLPGSWRKEENTITAVSSPRSSAVPVPGSGAAERK